MSMRSTWTGAITMGVMTFPVKLYAATEDKDIDRHNLHAKCKKAIKQIKVCPDCIPQDVLAKVSAALHKVGLTDEVNKAGLSLVMQMTDETMVKGYELTKGEYVVVTDAEMESIKLKSIKAVEILEFVTSDHCDPRMPEKHYFVAPDKAGAKPFAIMLTAMKDTGLYAIGKVMMRSTNGKESLVMLRPFGNVLLLHTLAWPEELRDASEVKVEQVAISEKERALGKQLVEIMLGDGDFTKHHDLYHKKLIQLLLTKSEGKDIEAAPAEAAVPASVDAVDALMRSIELAKNKGGDGPTVLVQAETVTAKAEKRPTVQAGVGEVPTELEPALSPAPKKRKATKTASPAAIW
jgi:DNA end-binding protein Ku